MKNQKKLSNSKLIAYSVAAGATIAIAPNALASIIHQTVDINFGDVGGTKDLKMEGDNAELRFSSFFYAGFILSAIYGEGAKVFNDGINAKALATTQYVGDGTDAKSNEPGSNVGNFYFNGSGDWTAIGPPSQMCGISFVPDLGSVERVYGWIAVQKISNKAGKITAWAYEDSGLKINVGDTGPVPEPATGLALLAPGAAGIAAYRRR